LAVSSDAQIIPATGLRVSGTGKNRTLRVTPTDGATGSAMITVTVSDGALSSSTTFPVTVTDSDDEGYYLVTEAESLSRSSSFVPRSDPLASGSVYLVSTSAETGVLVLTLSAPVTADYVIWCRVKAPDSSA